VLTNVPRLGDRRVTVVPVRWIDKPRDAVRTLTTVAFINLRQCYLLTS